MVYKKWRLKYYSNYIIKQILKKKCASLDTVKPKIILSKNSYIPKNFLNFYFYIYKGNMFRKLKVTKYSIAFIFGNFVLTKKPSHYPIKTKKLKR